MKSVSRKQITTLFFGLVFLLLVNACAAPVQSVAPAVATPGSFTLFLQPLPQESHRLTFSISELIALKEDGSEVVLPLTRQTFSAEQADVQQSLVNLTLSPGHYRGMALQIATASLKGEEGEIALSVPTDRLLLESPFTIRAKLAETLFLTLSADRLVTDGVLFTPKFSLWKPDRILTNLKGFVSNRNAHNLTIFNKRTAQVIGKLKTGNEPTALVLDQQRNWLYVALTGEDAILAIEITNGSILGRVSLRFGDSPTKLALTEDGRTLLCLNRGSESVSLIDTASLYETTRLRLLSEPNGIFLGRGSNQAYVTHAASSSMTVLDLLSRSIRRTVPLEESPLAGASSRDGRSLYLINDFSADLSVLDSSSLNTREKIYVGNGAISLKADPVSGLLYIGKQDGEIAVVDPRSQMAIDSFSLPGAVQDISIDNEENALFAVLPRTNSLLKIDLISKKVLGHLQLEAGGNSVAVMGER